MVHRVDALPELSDAILNVLAQAVHLLDHLVGRADLLEILHLSDMLDGLQVRQLLHALGHLLVQVYLAVRAEIYERIELRHKIRLV